MTRKIFGLLLSTRQDFLFITDTKYLSKCKIQEKTKFLNLTSCSSFFGLSLIQFLLFRASDFQLVLHPSIQIFKNGHYSSAFLTSLLSSNHHCQLLLLQEGVHLTATTLLLKNLQEREKSSIFYLRITSNLINETSGEAAFQLLNHTTSIGNLPVKTLHKCLELIFNSNEQYLIKESFWLLGNLLNHSNQKVRELLFESGILKDFESMIADKRNYL